MEYDTTLVCRWGGARGCKGGVKGVWRGCKGGVEGCGGGSEKGAVLQRF